MTLFVLFFQDTKMEVQKMIKSVQTRGIVKTSGFARGVCKNR